MKPRQDIEFKRAAFCLYQSVQEIKKKKGIRAKFEGPSCYGN